MHRIVAERVARGEAVQQYHGKWPFVRLAGVQEPASMLFSLLNLAGYAIGFPAFWAAVQHDGFLGKVRRRRRRHGARAAWAVLRRRVLIGDVRVLPSAARGWHARRCQMWLGYCACGANAWLWSTVFHTRDTVLTERMDYFSATLLSFAGCYCAIVRVFQLRRRAVRGLLALVVLALYLAHVSYLALVTFDYGWNMLVNIVASAIAGTLWVGWAIVRRPPHAWRALATIGVLTVAMSLELLDFPPLAWALDAHALWHAATIPTMLMWYRFLIADVAVRRGKAD